MTGSEGGKERKKLMKGNFRMRSLFLFLIRTPSIVIDTLRAQKENT